MPKSDSRPDLTQVLQASRAPRRRWPWAIALLAVALTSWLWLRPEAAPTTLRYDTTPVTRGDLTVTVIATGTVQPTTRVDISSELSGTLAAVMVDYNDEVSEGQILARLDSTNLQSRLTTAEAQLAAAAGRLIQAEASATEAAETWASTAALDQRGLAVRSTVIAAKAANDRAAASVAIAKADLQLAEASLEEAKTDLAKADIRSPISGIVLNRAAEKGMIVAATLNAPVLFTLAEDLSRMQLQVDIDEADIGRVAVGNAANFSVDAYPGRSFPAQITQLRYAPEETDGVVTYKAVLTVQNDDLLLRPGMTATATITVAREPGVLLVPMAALRYAPPISDGAGRSGGGLLGLIMPSGRGSSRGKADGSSIYVLRAGAPEKITITAGASDGKMIAVSAATLAEGDQVITGQSDR
ncbi:efflux RND transporter periplasmic adaptor subunit [Xinfangfangia sp. CPCC 101601]|uniref:Efflux RND transporter periplasmic adaptor subunit n=1 Tax=Pseudogemmobacter lacusdianii TaxID=3069608 RepID=A0ABU0W0X1_9RHOB|nr:efflux RND transporter periplasmic adaptor subunit [Xinfangfangia sp. CPCC 101601]MDQ2067662.1 efflux RND transporter periplasmic adaptor subunit [Xinfangfangia sp. CPCC 101601]